VSYAATLALLVGGVHLVLGVGRLDALPAEHAGVHTVVLDAAGVNHLDATGDHMLRDVANRLQQRGVRLLMVNVHEEVREVLDASGFTELVGAAAFFPTDADAVAHLDDAAG